MKWLTRYIDVGQVDSQRSSVVKAHGNWHGWKNHKIIFFFKKWVLFFSAKLKYVRMRVIYVGQGRFWKKKSLKCVKSEKTNVWNLDLGRKMQVHFFQKVRAGGTEGKRFSGCNQKMREGDFFKVIRIKIKKTCPWGTNKVNKTYVWNLGLGKKMPYYFIFFSKIERTRPWGYFFLGQIKHAQTKVI